MIDRFAKGLGLILMFVGILGFISPLTPDSKLFGIFLVNTPHNIVHLASGAILFAIGFSHNLLLTQRVVLAFAAIYGLITIMGFFAPVVFGMAVNMADNFLHLGVTVAALVSALPQRAMMR